MHVLINPRFFVEAMHPAISGSLNNGGATGVNNSVGAILNNSTSNAGTAAGVTQGNY